ncbi:MAG TPA: aldolase [Caldimonas sp.]|nr:aldolase [Caldimonas sp.]
MTSEATLRDEIVRVGASLHTRGYAHATAGNISVRLDDGWLITPTDACLGALDGARLAKVDAHGAHVSGDPASKTLALHRAIYAAEPSARCVLHTHASHLVALTLAGAWRDDAIVPPVTPYVVMKVGRVPLVPYARPGAPEVARLVQDAIAKARSDGRRLRAVMLDRLGPVAWHESPAAAMAVLEELEETAKIWLLSGRTAAPLDAGALDAIRVAFGAVW